MQGFSSPALLSFPFLGGHSGVNLALSSVITLL